jgi:hypothetical protein
MSFMLELLGQKFVIDMFRCFFECSLKDLLAVNLIFLNDQVLLGKMSFMLVTQSKVFHLHDQKVFEMFFKGTFGS